MATSVPTVSRKTALAGLGSLGLFAAGIQPAAPAQNSVAGAWRLESFDVLLRDGSRKPRFGPNPVGYLIYTASGRVSAVLSAAERPKFLSPDGTSSDTNRRTEAISEFLAYAGTYKVRGNRVFHTVETAVFTNLVGTTLVREFELRGDILTIRTVPPGIWGNESVLVWKRA